MALVRVASQLLNNGINLRVLQHYRVRNIFSNANSGANINDDEFEKRIFGGISGNNSKSDSFFQKLDRLEKARNFPGFDMNGRGGSEPDELDESFTTLSDGMDGKLKKAATEFEVNEEEIEEEEYSFRPDVKFMHGATYEPKDLDLRKPGIPKFVRREEFEVTTKEVLRKADFRNVRFLANFITDAGIIIKRSKTRISAKAQRKIAREIKTARAFGLMPFTTMGTKSFVFGKTMENLDKDFGYEVYDNRMPPEEQNDH